jgi:hypothetical protein
MAEKKDSKSKMLMYKGKPLVRNGNTIYYGSMADDFVAMLQILDSKDYKGVPLPQRVSIKLMSTDDNIDPKKIVTRSAEKPSLYEAINIASIWLERAQ